MKRLLLLALTLVMGCSSTLAMAENTFQPVSAELQLELHHQMRSAAASPLMMMNTKSTRDAWAQGLHATEECESDFASTGIAEDDYSGMTKVYQNNGIMVIEFQCMLGAYQGSYQYAVVDLNNPAGYRVKWLSIPQFTFDDTVATGHVVAEPVLAGLPTWDNTQPTRMSVFNKSRGIGDCGAFSEYQLTPAYDLSLLSVRARDCDDAHLPTTDAEVDPTHWPVVFPKK